MKESRMKIAVFASGRGSNFKALIQAARRGLFRKAAIALLVTDNPGAGAIAIAKKAKIPVALVRRFDYASRELFEKEMIRQLTAHGIRLIALAGFMRMLSPDFVRRYKGRIINIHPALLPAFKGSRGIKDAFLYGVKLTGVTVHFVDEEMDHGPIILQGQVRVGERDTLASLEAKIHRLEHELYPKALKLYSEGKLLIRGRRVRIR
jgi:phosphoribosylglycinamide formyltransferase 1